MSSSASKVLSTVNAPHRKEVTAAQLAEKISSIESVAAHDHAVFAFLSEVSPTLQRKFIRAMGLDEAKVAAVAQGFSNLAGFPMSLAPGIGKQGPAR